MKEKILIFLCVGILLIGCSPAKVEADKKLVGTLSSTMDNQTLNSTIEIEYNSKSGIATQGIFKMKYEGLEKTITNNDILANFINRQSIIEEIEGAKVSLKVTDTSFDYKETWNYNTVDVKEAMEADDQQKPFIKDEKYTVTKIKDYYDKQGYLFKEKEVK